MRKFIIIFILFSVGVFAGENPPAENPAVESALPNAAADKNLPPPNPPENPPVRLRVQWVPQAQFAGYIMAYEKGLFAQHGVDNVELLFSGVADSPLTMLANGECEYVTAWLTTAMQRCAAGMSIVSIAQFHRRSASMIVANKAHGIEKPTDLSGKTILTWGGDFAIEVMLFLRKHDIKPQAILLQSTSLSPFLKGVVAATQVMAYNEYLQLLALGAEENEMTVFRLDEYGIGIIGDGLYTTREHAQKYPAQVKALRAAAAAGWEYAFRHPQETVDKVMEYITRAGLLSNAFHQQQMLATIKNLMEFDAEKNYQQFGKLRYPDFAHTKLLLQQYGDNVDAVTYESFIHHE